MSSSLRIRVLAALSAAAVAVAGCSGAVSTEGEDESGDRLILPNDPGNEADLGQAEGTADVLGTCGDGTCDPGENCAQCSQDCGVCASCGNGVCNPMEDCSSCAQDCGACPCAHDVCALGDALDQACDPCVASICAVDSFCCDFSWDFLCVSEVASICGQQCQVTCGNGMCEAGEDCSSCSQDCGACPTCGDSICEWSENCSSCSQDCGACPVCGDGTCNGAETCGSCSQDCGACVCHDVCAVGTPLDPSCGQCEAQVCAIDTFCCQYSWDAVCVSEAASICGQQCPVACGNGMCESGEDCSSCSQDCGACPACGNGWCEAGEDCSSCSQDCGACPVCGDAICDWTEDCNGCSQDCGACPSCGDGNCDWGESCGSCSQDCGACVCHDVCTAGAPLDPSCGQCEAQVCAVDPFCCQGQWDLLCVSEVTSVCGQQCP